MEAHDLTPKRSSRKKKSVLNLSQSCFVRTSLNSYFIQYIPPVFFSFSFPSFVMISAILISFTCSLFSPVSNQPDVQKLSSLSVSLKSRFLFWIAFSRMLAIMLAFHYFHPPLMPAFQSSPQYPHLYLIKGKNSKIY